MKEHRAEAGLLWQMLVALSIDVKVKRLAGLIAEADCARG